MSGCGLFINSSCEFILVFVVLHPLYFSKDLSLQIGMMARVVGKTILKNSLLSRAHAT